MVSLIKKMIGIVAALWVVGTASVIYGDTLPMATGEWIPYSGEAMPHYGAFTKRVSTVCSEMGTVPDYRFYPWRRCFDSVIKHRVWAAFPYAFTEERAKEVWYSDTLSCSKTLFFHYDQDGRSKSYRVETKEDLKPYRLGGIKGYYYEVFFEKAGLDVDYVNKEIYGLEKLKLGRIDLMPMNEKVAWNLIDTHFPEERHRFKTLPIPLSVNTLHLIVSKGYPDSKQWLDRFNQTMKICVEKGLLTIDACQSESGLMQ